MVNLSIDTKNADKMKIPAADLIYFIKNIKGNWTAKITKHGNIKFCETDEKGNILHPNIFYTLYYDYRNGYYFRRACPSGYYQLFRYSKYTGKPEIGHGGWWHIEYDWKHFMHIGIAVAKFNEYYERCYKCKYNWTHYSFLGIMHDRRSNKMLLTDWKIRF